MRPPASFPHARYSAHTSSNVRGLSLDFGGAAMPMRPSSTGSMAILVTVAEALLMRGLLDRAQGVLDHARQVCDERGLAAIGAEVTHSEVVDAQVSDHRVERGGSDRAGCLKSLSGTREPRETQPKGGCNPVNKPVVPPGRGDLLCRSPRGRDALSPAAFGKLFDRTPGTGRTSQPAAHSTLFHAPDRRSRTLFTSPSIANTDIMLDPP